MGVAVAEGGAGVAVAEGGVCVAAGVGVPVAVGVVVPVGCGVAVGDAVLEGVPDGVASGVAVAVAAGLGVAVGVGVEGMGKAVAASLRAAAAAAAGTSSAGCFWRVSVITAEALFTIASWRLRWSSSSGWLRASSASERASRSRPAKSAAETFPREDRTRISWTRFSAWLYWISTRLSPRESVYSSRSFASLKL